MLHPQFDAFLRHALGNSKPLNDFLRRAAFERLTRSTESKVFLNLDDEGVGNTGKTTLLHCMRIVWGDYAVMVDADLFLASRHGTMSSNQESEWALTEERGWSCQTRYRLAARSPRHASSGSRAEWWPAR